MRILALVKGTIRELAAKATLYVLAGISTVIILVVALGISAHTSPEGSTITLFGNPVSAPVGGEALADIAGKIEAGFAGGLFVGIVLFGVFATAGVIPDALERGTVDLYLSKPIARWELILGKSAGSVAAIFLNILYFIGALWLVFGVKVGVWSPTFLVGALMMTFVFACLYAILAFVGVLSRNMAIVIIAGFTYLFIIAEILQNRERGLYLISESGVYRGVIDGFYYLLPQIPAMQSNVLRWISGDHAEWGPFLQSVLSSSGILGAACWLLQKKDF